MSYGMKFGVYELDFDAPSSREKLKPLRGRLKRSQLQKELHSASNSCSYVQHGSNLPSALGGDERSLPSFFPFGQRHQNSRCACAASKEFRSCIIVQESDVEHFSSKSATRCIASNY